MKKITTLFAFLAFGPWLLAQSTARIQAVHNSPDPMADTVSVYVNGQPLLQDIAFREASPFIDAPAGVPLRINVLPQGTNDTSNAVYSTTINLMANDSYILMAQGVLDTAGLATDNYFELAAISGAREMSSTSGEVEFLVAHAAPDAPDVDVVENSVLNTTLIDDLSYGSSTAYTNVPAVDYSLLITNDDQSRRFGEFAAPLGTLNLADSALVVAASGFAGPDATERNAFGLLAIFPNGATVMLPQSMAQLQIAHNSGDVLSADYIDVWIGQQKIMDSVEFRTASPYMMVPAQTDLDVSVMPIEENDTAKALAKATLRLEADSSAIAIVAGLVSGTPFDSLKPLQIYAHNTHRMANVAGNTDVLVFHGSVDAPSVMVDELTLPVNSLVDTLKYGEFAPYLELPTADYELKLLNAISKAHIATYGAPLSTLGLQDSSIAVVASGFADTLKFTVGDPDPLVVPKLGLYAILPGGGNFVPLPVISGIGVDEQWVKNMEIYPMPAREYLMLEFEQNTTATLSIRSLAGELISQEEIQAVNSHRLNLDDVAPGAYLLQITADNGVNYSQKILVQ